MGKIGNQFPEALGGLAGEKRNNKQTFVIHMDGFFFGMTQAGSTLFVLRSF
jgi:hypothetical protein